MYTIVSVIYGCPMTKAVWSKLAEMGKDDVPEEEYGFEEMYSGSAEVPPGYIGVDLGGFDEIDPVRIDLTNGKFIAERHSFSFAPTPQQEAEAQAKIDALPDELKTVLSPVGVWIVWSTS